MSASAALSRSLSWLERDHPSWVCLMPALLLLPFANKAFHIDDTQFLIHARLISESPFNPFVRVFEWDTMQVPIIDFPHPLLWQYGLAALRSVFGEKEVVLHAPVFVASLLGLLGLRSLARRLNVSALAACLLFAGSSAFLAMGSTIMPDVICVSLSLAAIAALVGALEDGRTGLGICAGLLAAAAFLTRFSAFLTIGWLLVYPLLRRHRLGRAYVPLLIGLSVAAAYEFTSFALADKPHFLSTLVRAEYPTFWANSPSLARDLRFAFHELTFLGAQLPVTGLVLVALGMRKGEALVVGFSSGLLAAGLALAVDDGKGLWPAVVLFAWPGALLILSAALQLVRGVGLRFEAPDAATALRWVLALWLIAATFATVRFEHVAAKYLLMPLPAACLLLLCGLRSHTGKLREIGRVWLWVSCVVGVATGFSVALSDYRWANSYREFVDTQWSERPKPVGRSYYNAQWGLRYYAQRAGMLPYRGGGLEAGDELLISKLVPMNWETAIPQQVAASYLLSYPGPFALMGFEYRAGFYSNFWGDYPFTLAREVHDTIFILREPQLR